MHLVAFLMSGPTSHHHGMWRHPESDIRVTDPAWYEHIARVLEQGKFDSLFFADIVGLGCPYNGHDTVVGRGGQMSLLDPIPLLAIMARATSRIGLGATLSTSFVPAFHIARTFQTLEHISGGRMAWNVVTSISPYEARNYGVQLAPRDERYDRADEVVEACMALWNSWAPDAIVNDKASGTFVAPGAVTSADYAGKWTKTAGPLTTPRGPQGHPVIMQAGSSERGRQFAARWAEMIFTLQHDRGAMQRFYADIKGRLPAHGRADNECAILTSVDPIIGETESIAREKQAYMNELVDGESGLALVSAHTGVDLSKIDVDCPVEDLDLDGGSRGSLDVLIQGARAGNLTLREAARKFATSELCPQVVGTPEQVADQLQDYFESKGCDGFIITPTVFPGSFEVFARSVVPILQKRGIFRTEYEGPTLRQNLRS
jgi:FMN-dependent oxidoreductase (nitrilotriacetate monooxygenase family)